MISSVVFDLDVLLDYSPLQDSSLNSISSSKTFGNPRDGFANNLPGLVKDKGLKVGVLSKHSRKCSTDLLRKYSIPYDLLHAGDAHDSQSSSSSIISRVREQLGVDKSELVYFGSTTSVFEDCSRENIRSLGADWVMRRFNQEEISKSAPDVILSRPHGLTEYLKGSALGYICEELAAGNEPIIHKGSFYSVGNNVFALGRYYQKSDYRHYSSLLSQHILDLKIHDNHALMFAYAVKQLLSKLRGKFCVVPVPPQSGVERNRFKRSLAQLKKMLPHRVIDLPNGLRSTKKEPNYKKMGREERILSRQGMFRSNVNWNRKKVVLLDDVITTGTTIRACTELIKKDRPSTIYSVVFGRTQRVNEFHYCPICGEKLVVRQNREKKTFFWGCSNYHPNGGCPYTKEL